MFIITLLKNVFKSFFSMKNMIEWLQSLKRLPDIGIHAHEK